MRNELPKKTRVAIVGGGVIGCSIAYHLTKIGWDDVILLERKQITSGTTWHAAGLIGQLRDSQNMTKLAKYTAELYLNLEEETGQATGYKINGSLSTATHEGRMEDLLRRADMAKVFGLQVDVLGPDGCKDHYPLLNVDDVVGGIFIPSDGQADPIGITQALAKGARAGGAKIFENTPVSVVLVDEGQAVGVSTDQGNIYAEFVVLACGMWTRNFAAKAGVSVPLHACEHFYVLTEPNDAITSDLPVYRDYDAHAYYKEDAGKLLLGAFEPVAKPWGMEGIPENFEFGQLPDDYDHFMPILESAMHRMPLFNELGIQTFFCGPESFTHDDRYHIGPAPEVNHLFIAAGLNSIGIQSAGGIGQVLAAWMRDGLPPFDLNSVDIRRNMSFQGNAAYLRDRVTETLGLLYDVHWPFYQYKTSRGVRRLQLHDRHVAAGACFGEVAGWERPNWYAPSGVDPVYQYSFKRQNWFEYSANEHNAVREDVGFIDMSAFAKFRVQGADAESVLNWVSANDVAVTPGRTVYTQWLNHRGGIEADLTVTRLANDDYIIITAAGSQVRDFQWLKAHIPSKARCVITDVTSGAAVFAVMGPRSREFLQPLTTADLSNEGFPFGASLDIEIGYATVRATRITYVGELGWEIYVPSEMALHVYEILTERPIVHVGMHAVNSLRIEKAYRHWGHDISGEDNPLEAGLGFAISWNKPGGFLGKDALIPRYNGLLKKRLVQFQLKDPKPLLYHNEPVYIRDKIIGYITSGMYGHHLGGAIGLGYISDNAGIDENYINNNPFEILVAGKMEPAKGSIRPLYDPKSKRIRA